MIPWWAAIIAIPVILIGGIALGIWLLDRSIIEFFKGIWR